MKKFVVAAVFTLVAFSYAMAEEFTALVTKCDADKGCIEYKKQTKAPKKGVGAEYADAKIGELAKGAKILKGMAIKGKVEEGDPIEGGLKSEVFTKAPEAGLNARVTIADEDNAKEGIKKGQVTKIVVTKGKGK